MKKTVAEHFLREKHWKTMIDKTWERILGWSVLTKEQGKRRETKSGLRQSRVGARPQQSLQVQRSHCRRWRLPRSQLQWQAAHSSLATDGENGITQKPPPLTTLEHVIPNMTAAIRFLSKPFTFLTSQNTTPGTASFPNMLLPSSRNKCSPVKLTTGQGLCKATPIISEAVGIKSDDVCPS